MTKAHVPPQAAGNRMIQPSYYLMSTDLEVEPGRAKLGGIHFYGHCAACNSRIGQRYDAAYGDFAEIMREVWIKDWKLEYPTVVQVPDGTFYPGKVVRSILLGMCATSSYMYTRWPGFVQSMLEGEAVRFPFDLHLYLALGRGRSARVNGHTAGMDFAPNASRSENGTSLITMSVSSVYFPPLAWELVIGDRSFPRVDGWIDIGSWSLLDSSTECEISDLIPPLPAVAHPQHTADRREHWAEMMSNEISIYAECMDIENVKPDAALRSSFHDKLRIEIDDLARAYYAKGRQFPGGFRESREVSRGPQSDT